MSNTPWKAAAETKHERAAVTDADGKPIAEIYGDSKEDRATNARLIAAAPDLLEACKLCARELQAMHSYHHPTCEGGCPFDEANNQARSAIAKAETA